MNLARNYESYYSNGSLLYTEGNKKGYKDFDTANILNLAGNVISTVRENESDPFDENIYFYSYNKDIRNSTSSVVDANNSGVVAYEYDDFGNTEVLGDTSFNNEICYTEGIYDINTKEYYLNARYYDPETARFTTLDTYRGETEEPLSLHLYAYCQNDPINYTDIDGHRRGANKNKNKSRTNKRKGSEYRQKTGGRERNVKPKVKNRKKSREEHGRKTKNKKRRVKRMVRVRRKRAVWSAVLVGLGHIVYRWVTTYVWVVVFV